MVPLGINLCCLIEYEVIELTLVLVNRFTYLPQESWYLWILHQLGQLPSTLLVVRAMLHSLLLLLFAIGLHSLENFPSFRLKLGVESIFSVCRLRLHLNVKGLCLLYVFSITLAARAIRDLVFSLLL